MGCGGQALEAGHEGGEKAQAMPHSSVFPGPRVPRAGQFSGYRVPVPAPLSPPHPCLSSRACFLHRHLQATEPIRLHTGHPHSTPQAHPHCPRPGHCPHAAVQLFLERS